VGSVGVGSEACDFRDYFRSAFFGVFVFFQNQTACPLADNKTVAVFVISGWCFMRTVIFGACGKKRVKDGGVCGAHFLRTPRDHDVLHAILYSLISETNGLTAGCAGGVRCNYPSCQAENYADIRGAGLGHGFYISGCVHFCYVAHNQHAVKIKKRIDAAHRRTVRDTGSAAL